MGSRIRAVIALALVASLSGCFPLPQRPPTDAEVIAELEETPGVTEVTLIDGWPYVRIADLDRFDAAFDALRLLPQFEDGGTFSLEREPRFSIVWVPKRSSPDLIHELVAIGHDHPAAELQLQAGTAGPQWPALYIAGLTADEVTELDARLRAPALAAGADVEGYPVEFTLTTITGDGPQYTYGILGDVPGSRMGTAPPSRAPAPSP